MTKKEELTKRLGTLSDKAYLRYLMETEWCVRETVELSIMRDWTDEDVERELQWLKEKKIVT